MTKKISITRLSKGISARNGTGIRQEHKKTNAEAISRGNAEHERFDREVRYFFSDKSVKSKRLIQLQMLSVLALSFVSLFVLFVYF